MTTGQTYLLTLHFQKHSDFVQVSFTVQRTHMLQRIWGGGVGVWNSSVEFIHADILLEQVGLPSSRTTIIPLRQMTLNTQDKLLPALERATKGSESFSK